MRHFAMALGAQPFAIAQPVISAIAVTVMGMNLRGRKRSSTVLATAWVAPPERLGVLAGDLPPRDDRLEHAVANRFARAC